MPQSEMIAEYFTNVGIRTQMKQNERNFQRERLASNDLDLLTFTLASVSEYAMRAESFGNMRPGGQAADLSFMKAYELWFTTNGQQGEEPPEFIKRLYAQCQEWATLAPSNPRYAELGKATLDEINSNIWFIGTMVAPRVVIISNRLGNTPTEGFFTETTTSGSPSAATPGS